MCAGNLLFAGGKGFVAAVDRESGKEVWSDSVEGCAVGLVVTGGRLFVSTDTGPIYCYKEGTGTKARDIKATVNTSPYSGGKDIKAAADEIIKQTTLSSTQVFSVLTILESENKIKNLGANTFGLV